MRFILRTDEKSVPGRISTLTRLLNAGESGAGPKISSPGRKPSRGYTARRDFSNRCRGRQSRGKQRLDKEIARIETEARAAEKKLENKSFVDRAPAAVVEEHRQRLKDFSAQLEKLKQARECLN